MNLCVDDQCFDVFVNIAELAYKSRMFCLISFDFRLFVIFVLLFVRSCESCVLVRVLCLTLLFSRCVRVISSCTRIFGLTSPESCDVFPEVSF